MAFSIWSCNNDDAASDDNNPPVVFQDSISLKVNGEPLDTYVHDVWKTERAFEIVGGHIHVDFDESGKLARFAYEHQYPTGITRMFYNIRNYADNYFNFQMTFDPATRRVSGWFSGYVYANPDDFSSEGKFVEGTFDQGYELLFPTVSNQHNTAKISGNPWISIYNYQENSVPGVTNSYRKNFYSGDPYRISILHKADVAWGTYNFTPSTAVNTVRLSRFDTQTQSYIDYNCTGTFTVTQNEANIYSGTYQFTAVNPANPSDVIPVTEGSFKFIRT